MALRHSRALTFRALGVSDTMDATNSPPGMMAALTNLIPSPSTDRYFVPRPAAVRKTAFAGFTTPGFVSSLLVVGDIAYGTVASGRNAGKDEPFAYDLANAAFLTVGGIINANTPTSPLATGDWTPPIVAQVAQRVIVTHPGFAGGAVKFGWFDISGFSDATHTGTTHTSTTIDTLSADVLQAGWQPGMTIAGAGIVAGTTIVSIAANGLSIVISVATTAGAGGIALTVAGGTRAAPLWGAGDTNLNPLPSVPVAVAQFNGRAYYACGVNGIPFSDSLLPCNRTNATQALTTNDGLAVTALGALGLNALTGGIVQSIIAFQGNAKIQQITGDPVTNNLLMNAYPVSTGTLAPLSICSITAGLAFASPEGLRVISTTGVVSDPVGDHGQGVTIPFINALNPSRICAAANADSLRLSVANTAVTGSPYQEWWFDLTRKVWTGPHTFPASQIELWRNTFLEAPVAAAASLWQSDSTPNASPSFVENGVSLSCLWTTSLLPDNDTMSANAMVETAIGIALPAGSQAFVSCVDDEMNVLNAVSITGAGGGATIWGSFTWGAGRWGANSGVGVFQRRLLWTEPLVFKQSSMSVAVAAASGVALGNLYMKYEQLGYLMPQR